MVWYGMYVTCLLQFTKQVMKIAKNRGDRTGFEDVDDIGASTFESWDWSVQFPVTALVLWLLGSRREA